MLMSNDETFTILSVGAPLVEVDGDGPTLYRPDGVAVPDGIATTAPVHLLTAPVRRWLVDAQTSVQATVSITDSPFGAFVGVRRCVSPIEPVPWSDWLAIRRWPRLRAFLERHARSLLALWYLYTDQQPAPCKWQDIGDNNRTSVDVRGGDLVVVTFVTP
jgi:hypothetical protein